MPNLCHTEGVEIVQSDARNGSLVIVMGPDPEPCHGIAIAQTKSPIAARDAHRPDRLRGVNALELQPRMRRVAAPRLESTARPVSYFFGQVVETAPKSVRCP